MKTGARPKIFSKNGKFSAKTGVLESQQFISRKTLVITFHKLYHRHSERLSKSLWERSPPSWIRMSPLLMPHIPQDKSDKTRESPTYWGLKELPIWWWSPTKASHIPGWGGGGVGSRGLLWLMHYVISFIHSPGIKWKRKLSWFIIKTEIIFLEKLEVKHI